MEEISNLIYMGDVIGSINDVIGFIIFFSFVACCFISLFVAVSFLEERYRNHLKVCLTAFSISATVLTVATIVDIIVPSKETVYGSALLKLKKNYPDEDFREIEIFLRRGGR